tara:strand:- start:1278 stop:1541 length:264 start_codon:yes stop_codon:yes gene_type:complete
MKTSKPDGHELEKNHSGERYPLNPNLISGTMMTLTIFASVLIYSSSNELGPSALVMMLGFGTTISASAWVLLRLLRDIGRSAKNDLD